MNTRKLTAALAVMGAFVLMSSAATTTTNMAWNIDFDGLYNPTKERGNFAGLTNQVTWTKGDGESAYARFSSVGEDQTAMVLLPDFNATNGWNKAYPTGCAPANDLLSLNTSGTDLQFNLVQSDSNDTLVPVGEAGSSVLVDADVYFVAAESEPNVADDTSLQAALYLMCETATEDDEVAGIFAGDVTNTSLRVWTFDTGLTRNVWRALSHPSVTVEDGSWHHVQVVMDYTGTYPEIKVLIDGYAMEDTKGATSFRISNFSNFESDSAKHLNSVSFRGTGAVDNFVGATLTTTSESYEFSVASFLDQEPMITEEYIYPSKIIEEGKVARFTSICTLHDDGDGNIQPLRMVRVFDPASPTSYTDYVFPIDETQEYPILTFPDGSSLFTDINQEDSFMFTLNVDTTGATGDTVLANLYYGTYPGGAPIYKLTYDLAEGNWPLGYTQKDTWAADAGDFDLPNPMKEGYEFAGWTVEGVPVKLPMELTGDTEFVATWTPATFAVTFKDGEAVLFETNVLYNTTVEKPADPSKDGFEFVAWVTIDDATTNAFDFATPITEATTLYATWNAAEKPEVIAVDIESIELSGTTATIGFTTKQVGVKYFVLTNATLTGTFVEADGASLEATEAEKPEVIAVKDLSADAMFFKLGAEWPEE